MKLLIACFSAEHGKTLKIAKDAALALGADLFEIKPERVYTEADLNWKNPLARCNREKFGNRDVPVVGRIEGFDEYDAVLLGFPIWYGGAPNVVNTFCKGYSWYGKRIAAFATSGGSGIGKTAERLRPFVAGGELLDARLVHNSLDLEAWVRDIL